MRRTDGEGERTTSNVPNTVTVCIVNGTLYFERVGSSPAPGLEREIARLTSPVVGFTVSETDHQVQ
jgi:hypothetical protein